MLLHPDHPGEQIHLGNHSHSLHGAAGLRFRYYGRAVPFKESTKRAQRGISGNLHKLAPFTLLLLLIVQGELADVGGIDDDLGQCCEVEHDFGNRIAWLSTAGTDITEQIAQSDEADQTIRGRRNRQLVEALVTHGFYSLGAWRFRVNRRDGLQTKGGDGCSGEWVFGFECWRQRLCEFSFRRRGGR